MATGLSRPFAELFGGRPGDGHIASIARASARAQFPVIPIAPGTKQPLCTLTDRQKTAEDRAAAHAARDAGRRNWERVRHACGIAHVMTDPQVAYRVFKRLAEKYEQPLNIAVDILQARALVVDADTAAELESFTALWAQQEREPDLCNAAPTVYSPGEIGIDGQWKHSAGGHFWFLFDDDVDLGPIGNVTSIPIGADAENKAQLKVSGYVLVPPSVRPEGEYRMASDAHPAPAWLVEYVQLYLTERRVTRQHRADRCLDSSDTATLEQAAIAWASLLEPRGWTLSWKVDRCGCEVYTAPGEHANPKSATAHDPGCAQFDTADGFLHVWTDNPPEGLGRSQTKTFSKIQFVAWSDYDGDMGTAMRELGISREPRTPTVLGHREDRGSPACEDEGDDSDHPPDIQRTSWWFRDLAPVLAGENPEPQPSVLAREDGACLFYRGKVNGILGPSESGKSWVALQAVAQQLHAAAPVLYLDFEDTAAGIVSRLRDLGVSDDIMAPAAALLAYVGPEEALHAVAYAEYTEVLGSCPWSLIVFDGVNAAMTQDGLDLLSNTDATRFFTKVLRPAALTGAAVVTIDHVPKDTDKRGKGGIGAQAKRATITGSAVYVEVMEPFGRARSGSLTLIVDKDRPGYVRGAANAKDEWARVSIDAGQNGQLSLTLAVPEKIDKRTGSDYVRADEFRIKVIEYLEKTGADLPATTIEKSVTGNSARIREALAWLSENGFVTRRFDPRNSRVQLHKFAKRYPPSAGLRLITSDGQ